MPVAAAEMFVGRGPELQRALRALRSGERAGVLLHAAMTHWPRQWSPAYQYPQPPSELRPAEWCTDRPADGRGADV